MKIRTLVRTLTVAVAGAAAGATLLLAVAAPSFAARPPTPVAPFPPCPAHGCRVQASAGGHGSGTALPGGRAVVRGPRTTGAEFIRGGEVGAHRIRRTGSLPLTGGRLIPLIGVGIFLIGAGLLALVLGQRRGWRG